MSGNMSVLNEDKSNDKVRPRSPPFSGETSGDRSISSISMINSSITDNSPSLVASFYEGQERKTGNKKFFEKDVWGTRIILSALEDIAFDGTPFPKLSSSHILALQKFLLAVHAANFNYTPFVGPKKSGPTSILKRSIPQSVSGSTPSRSTESVPFRIEEGIMEELEALPIDSKIVIRSLVSTYIRNIASKIVELWVPLLEAEGISLPAPLSVSEKKKFGSTSESACSNLKKTFDAIITLLKGYNKHSTELDVKIRELMKTRCEEMKKFESETDRYKELVQEITKEESRQNDPEFLKTYFDYIQLEKQCLQEELRLEKLRQDEEENPADEQEETSKMYGELKALYEKMLVETEEMEKKLEQYKSLGAAYTTILEEYQDVEEQIKTKEWVKEQLKNGPKDDSLFSDSF